MRQGIQQLLTRAGLLLVGVAIAAPTAGCDNKRTVLSEEQSEKGLGLPDSTSTRRKITIDPRCELNEEVVEPTQGEPEWIIHQLLEAASSEKDDDASFEKFYGHFESSKAESWVRRQYWPRARKHVSKYLQGDASQGVVYKICRRDKLSDTKVKIWIQSLDPKKSNPPMTFVQEEGKWKVSFFTP